MDTSPFMRSVREKRRSLPMALSTEKTYCYWIRFFIRHQGYRNIIDSKAEDVTAFLSYLAVERHVSANTQNQAFSALLFLCRHVLNFTF